ncbi:DUF6412 domain-containing protein [Verrucosispora sioxanthis]|uniref:Uncharacterized protein n=1 Tax=Verrucosispora sioxanthis TaxID=2499994 RepID=A0A6M1LDQ2_9ACTN|nr:DUF6412 domain-containing protein [Verrucosispora sioxanthis]NEE67227.1 hypothetical protein [Verrucosispora sioxanthis]NGM16337.1 hypothetical protein [Verrucosispora sioxanthis]
MIGLGLLWHLVGVLADVGATSMLSGTAAVTGALLTALLAAAALIPALVADPDLRITRRMLRERSGRTGVPRHRDPDAAGRARPRAPTTATLAVALASPHPFLPLVGDRCW